MTTSLSHSWTYDAPLADVQAMLFDPVFREQVCDAQHAVSRAVQIEGDLVVVTYAQAMDRAPAFAKKLVGDTISITQREQWTGPEAAIEILVPGKPGSASGRFSLIDDGATTTQAVVLEVTAKLPLVGGKIEALIRDLLLKAFAREARTGREWLAG